FEDDVADFLQAGQLSSREAVALAIFDDGKLEAQAGDFREACGCDAVDFDDEVEAGEGIGAGCGGGARGHWFISRRGEWQCRRGLNDGPHVNESWNNAEPSRDSQ